MTIGLKITPRNGSFVAPKEGWLTIRNFKSWVLILHGQSDSFDANMIIFFFFTNFLFD